jgi:hypothetical protein
MNGREFLQGFHVPEFRHRAFPYTKRLVSIFSPVVEPPAAFLIGCIPENIHRCPVRPKWVRNDHLWLTVAFHRAPQVSEVGRCPLLAEAVEKLR